MMTSLNTIQHGDIWISDNDNLESLDFVSLTKVGGSITIKNNRNLCFVNNHTFQNITSLRRIFVGQNKDPQLCEQEKKVCHEECTGECWGPGNKQCRSCKNFIFQDECISSCTDRPDLYENGRECRKCHSQCKDGCKGQGPLNCSRCLNAKDDNECVERCPENKYLDDETKTCQPCHPFCHGGCTGPSLNFGRDGCNDCKLLYNTTNVCVDELNFKCKTTKYTKLEDRLVATDKGPKKLRQMSICYDCHPLCKTCSDGGSHACECWFVEYKGGCLDSCPPQHYKDIHYKCQLCHQECDDCYGSTADMCKTCKNVRIYWEYESNTTDHKLNSSLENQSVDNFNITDKFYCNSTCPVHIPDKFEFTENDVPQRKCMSLLSQTKRKAMIGLLVLGAFGLLCAAVVVFAIWKRQKAKTEESEAKMQAQIEGINAYELLTPSKVRPDSITSLRTIKETELIKNEEIGCGHYGTVFRGIWHPEDEKIKVPVAIKVFPEGSTITQHKELLEEARVMASVSHPCCIRILAVCLTRQLMLITPLVAHGTMLDYLLECKSRVGSHSMLKWAAQIARGMNYLESKGIVHRNLSARNIMVQSINQVKITDFMIPKFVYPLTEHTSTSDDKDSSNLEIQIKWLSMEAIQYNIFTHKSDVWSYGVTLWELFTYGQTPYENISAVDIADHLEMGERLPQPSICTIDVYMVMIKCWMVEASSRPSFQELEEEFAGMTRDPGRFLVIPGDKLMRIPSDFIEDNRTELMRQMNLSESDDIVCGEDYLGPSAFVFPYRTFSDKQNKLTSVLEEEETSFQINPDYNNIPRKSSKPEFKHQSSSASSGSTDGTFTHLEAATAVFEGFRSRNSSARYLGSPNSESSSGDLMNFPQTPRPPSLDEKQVMKLEHAYANAIDCSGESYYKPKVENEDYLEPQFKSAKRDLSYVDMKSPGISLDNPEYLSHFPNKFFPS